MTTQILTLIKRLLATIGGATKINKAKKPVKRLSNFALTLKMPIRSENPKNLAGLGAEAGAL